MRSVTELGLAVAAFIIVATAPAIGYAQVQVDEYGFLERWQLLSDAFRAGNLELDEQGLPADHDTELTKASNEGLFEVAISPLQPPYPFNAIHDWQIRVTRPDGSPVSGAEISMYGGMPLHNHGYPTEPRVTGEIEPGVYALEGVKFSMSGWWTLAMGIISGDEKDSVSFNVVVKP